MAYRIPRLGGELPTYITGMPKRAPAIKQSLQRTVNGVMQANYNPSTFVQRSPRENIGTPGTSKFVQRSPKENIGTPGTSTYVQRDFTNDSMTPRNSSTPRKRPLGQRDK